MENRLTFSEHLDMGLEISNQLHEVSAEALRAREPYLIAGTSTGLLQTLTGKKCQIL